MVCDVVFGQFAYMHVANSAIVLTFLSFQLSLCKDFKDANLWQKNISKHVQKSSRY